mgnify:FL=1
MLHSKDFMPSISRLVSSSISSFAIVPFLVGGLAVGYGCHLALRTQQQLQPLVAANGRVIENQLQSHRKRIRKNESPSMSVYHPVVEFTAQNGKVVRFTDAVGTDPPDYQIGDSVTVLYHPQQSQKAQIQSWKRLWFFPTIAIAGGSIAIFAGLGALWQYQHTK